MGLVAVGSVETGLPSLGAVLVESVGLLAAVAVRPCAAGETAALAARAVLARVVAVVGVVGVSCFACVGVGDKVRRG